MSVISDEPVPIFIDARAGTGKTFLLNTIISAVRTKDGKKHVVIANAYSGNAACLLDKGTWVFSRKDEIHLLTNFIKVEHFIYFSEIYVNPFETLFNLSFDKISAIFPKLGSLEFPFRILISFGSFSSAMKERAC